MADPVTAAIVATLQFAGEMAATAQQRAIGKAQARGLEEQARAAGLEAGIEEEAQRRQAAFQMGETRAAGAQMGLAESVTFGDVYSQAATAAELDALNIRFTGEGRRKGLMYEAAVTRAARPKWGAAIISAGARALGTYSGLKGPSAAGGVKPSSMAGSSGGGFFSTSGGGSAFTKGAGGR